MAIYYINRRLSPPSKQFTCSIPSSLDSSFNSFVSRPTVTTYEETTPVSHDMNRTDSYRQKRQHAATEIDRPKEVYPWLKGKSDEGALGRPKLATIAASPQSSYNASSPSSSLEVPGDAGNRHKPMEEEKEEKNENRGADVAVANIHGERGDSREAQCHSPLLVVARDPDTRSRAFTCSLPDDELMQLESSPPPETNGDS